MQQLHQLLHRLLHQLLYRLLHRLLHRLSRRLLHEVLVPSVASDLAVVCEWSSPLAVCVVQVHNAKGEAVMALPDGRIKVTLDDGQTWDMSPSDLIKVVPLTELGIGH